MFGLRRQSETPAAMRRGSVTAAAMRRQSVTPAAMSALELTFGTQSHTLPIPSHLYSAACHLRDDYILTLNPAAVGLEAEEEIEVPESSKELVLGFLVFLAASDEHDVAISILDSFEETFLRGANIHSVVARLNKKASAKAEILRYYYELLGMTGHTLQEHEHPALGGAVKAGNAKVVPIFGGQGNTEDLLEELRTVYVTYRPQLASLFKAVNSLLATLSTDPRVEETYTSHPFDILEWIDHPEKAPAKEEILSAAVSFPLIGLLSLAHYAVFCSCSKITPGTARQFFAGTTGHSQGIVVAAAVAAADDWKSFEAVALKAITVLFWIGFRSQDSWFPATPSPSLISDALKNDEGSVSSMLRVRGLTRAQIKVHVDGVNAHLPKSQAVYVSLINGRTSIIVSGPPLSLCGLCRGLRALKASKDAPKTPISMRYLSTNVPFHSPYLLEAREKVMSDVSDIEFSKYDLKLPVYDTRSGSDMRLGSSQSLVAELVATVMTAVVDWPRATQFPGVTHVLDFGPGLTSGIGAVVQDNSEGLGIRVILATVFDGQSSGFGYQPELLSLDTKDVKYETNWGAKFAPRLINTPSGLVVDNKYTRFFGMAPFMVAGMTPTTAHWDLVAASLNAGYHAELAGGGYFNAATMEVAIKNIARSIRPGRGITCNVIYASPTAMAWQIPMVRKLTSEGVNIEGLTIGAGVPSLDVANEYIRTLGLRHISFKPGTAEAMQSVIVIAKANPDFTIILQWTGGRGGGHHSKEDFHAPLLHMYSKIRRAHNIILVVGSGFGSGEDTYPYLTGTWALPYGMPAMPVDGVLFGSRVMTAAEAHTSLAAKQAIVDAPGVDDSKWSNTYKTATGGVITVKSEMGEPIHKLATRGVLFWAEMDAKVFSVDRSKRVAVLKGMSSYIKDKLDKDFQKPWFCKTRDGKLVDLEGMTYMEVLTRLANLLYMKSRQEWINPSYRNLYFNMVRRVEERLSDKQIPSIVTSPEAVKNPIITTTIVGARYPSAFTELMKAQDVQFFLSSCKTRGQKPVPFVPRLDEDFETYFKKDSLWQSEMLEAVVDEDVGRVCVLHGPVAAKFATKVNEPIAEILGDMEDYHVYNILKEKYSGKVESVPAASALSSDAVTAPLPTILTGISVETAKDCITYTVTATESADMPSEELWYKCLSGNVRTWRSAMFEKDILWGTKRHANPFRRIFAPRMHMSVDILHPDEPYKTVMLLRLAGSKLLEHARACAPNDSSIRVEMYEYSHLTNETLELPLRFSYVPELPYLSIREELGVRNLRVKQFYYKLWFGEECQFSATANSEFVGDKMSITRDMVKKFTKALNIGSSPSEVYAPVDMAMVIAWKALTKPLFLKSLDGDLITLVHLSNRYERVPGCDPIRIGDIVSSKAKVSEIANIDSGCRVQVRGEIIRDGRPCLLVITEFLYRGAVADAKVAFKEADELIYEQSLKSDTDVNILMAKPWFTHENATVDLEDLTVQYKLRTRTTPGGNGLSKTVRTFGQVLATVPGYEYPVVVGSVEFQADNASRNAVLDYLSRHASTINGRVMLDPLPRKRTLPIDIPASNELYAKVSGDYNPIHVSPTFSELASLPGTITHGMYTCAVARNLVQSWEADNSIQRFHSFNCSFVGMVLPRNNLQLAIQHVGMIAGRKILKVTVSDTITGDAVLQGEAEVEEPRTAYIFTGQGSQEQNMGMELYAKSSVAKNLWDKSDAHLMERFGFSILDIIRRNPKELVIKFGGPRGRVIHKNFMDLTMKTTAPNGVITYEPILKELTPECTSFTFRSPTGLLFATQFAQLAIVLQEKAAFEDMRAHGLVQADSKFAGHSLGEYGALSAMGDVVSLETLLFFVFYRGLTMQNALERDEAGRTEYAMCAVNPSRLSAKFDERSLKYVIAKISKDCECLLEIVNYNIANQQYVAAGHLVALDALGTTLDQLHVAAFSLKPIFDITHPDHGSTLTQLSEIITGAKLRALKKPKPLALKRGLATIPLAGIDVPFHSSHLRNGVDPFRAMLMEKIKVEGVNPSTLVGKYIPNLTAKPFSLSKEYFEETYALTQSPRIKDVLDNWAQYHPELITKPVVAA